MSLIKRVDETLPAGQQDSKTPCPGDMAEIRRGEAKVAEHSVWEPGFARECEFHSPMNAGNSQQVDVHHHG
eukprot:CAMPEP_0175983262 /NCGR_PEP_ID=MMETSP0108-20121206/48355_1 /TAXON_ID=195067 ORGANISM="Goniomonas pacifica, Strain CCMP1869" /NCGR_SAMPLE_ID=MMETSP0108 /ASSEMBLY_ACC=CAM_ASM_000204 /LENGTH=70 /DNA_ID=CAMNT_0017314007 /DNA_START=258 /DNA_END=466 /DNA_ORIENTATION=+